MRMVMDLKAKEYAMLIYQKLYTKLWAGTWRMAGHTWCSEASNKETSMFYRHLWKL